MHTIRCENSKNNKCICICKGLYHGNNSEIKKITKNIFCNYCGNIVEISKKSNICSNCNHKLKVKL